MILKEWNGMENVLLKRSLVVYTCCTFGINKETDSRHSSPPQLLPSPDPTQPHETPTHTHTNMYIHAHRHMNTHAH